MPIPTHDARAERRLVPASEFETRIGAHRWAEIGFPRRRYKAREHLVWGPHLRLRPGRYDMELLVRSTSGSFELLYDMVADGASRVIGCGVVRVATDDHPRIGLYLAEAIDGFECRLRPAQTGRLPEFRFSGIVCTRAGSDIGSHQSEAMALLAHLTVLRLQRAFAVAADR
jgi:hypothetical protein